MKKKYIYIFKCQVHRLSVKLFYQHRCSFGTLLQRPMLGFSPLYNVLIICQLDRFSYTKRCLIVHINCHTHHQRNN